ncbi:MAG: 2-keto-4-pentenoate hydratase [Pseudomonadota bacterium]
MTDPDDLAAKLAEDIRHRRPFRDLPPEELPDEVAAHEAQARVVARVYGEGEAIGGRKIAWNAPGQVEKMGLSAPGAGVVPRDLIHNAPPVLREADYLSFAIEPEIAAVLKAPLAPREGGHTRASVAAAIDLLAPAFELLDPRGASGPRPESFIATNINNRGLVLGGPGLPPEAVDAAALPSVVTCNGEPWLEKVGAAPMHPLDAAVFLADHFNARGVTLQPGEVLLLGTHMPLRRVSAPARLRFELGALGVAELELV